MQLVKLPQKDILLTHHDAHCTFTYSGKKYPPHVGSIIYLIEKANYSWVVISAPSSKYVGNKHYYNAYCFNRTLFVARYLAGLLSRMGLSETADSVRAFPWRLALQAINPRLIISIQPLPGLCLAARQRNIPLYEYQHGVISAKDWWRDKAGRLKPRRYLPDGMLCWDGNSAFCVNREKEETGIYGVEIGNLWMNRFVKKEKEDVLVNSINCSKRIKDSDTNILVTLQWGLEKHYYQDHSIWVIPECLSELIKKMSDQVNWLIRMHPVQIANRKVYQEVDRYLNSKFMNQSNVLWEEPTALPLPFLLKMTDLHITDMSSTIIEAAYFNIPTAILNKNIKNDEYLYGLFKKEIECGIAEIVDQVESEIYRWIKSRKSVKKTGGNPGGCSMFYDFINSAMSG